MLCNKRYFQLLIQCIVFTLKRLSGAIPDFSVSGFRFVLEKSSVFILKRLSGVTPFFVCCDFVLYWSRRLLLLVQYLVSLFSSYTLFLAVGRHALRKTSDLPNQTCYICRKDVEECSQFTAIDYISLADYFGAFYHPKNASETKAVKSTALPTGQLEKRASSRATVVVQPWTSATMPTTRIPTGASLEHTVP